MYIYENSLLTDDYDDWNQYHTSCRKWDSQRLPPEQGIMNLIVQLCNLVEILTFKLVICTWVQTRTKLFIHIFWLPRSHCIYHKLLEWQFCETLQKGRMSQSFIIPCFLHRGMTKYMKSNQTVVKKSPGTMYKMEKNLGSKQSRTLWLANHTASVSSVWCRDATKPEATISGVFSRLFCIFFFCLSNIFSPLLFLRSWDLPLGFKC